jgi:outer membrane lipoprotein-sorting protein
LLFALRAAPATASPTTVDAILADFRGLSGLEARYSEEKRLTMLAAPLRSEGQLDFAPPNRLAKRETAPGRSVLVVDGNTLSFRDAQGSKTLSIDTYPVARLLIDGFLQILSGNTEALRRLYEIVLKPARDGAWTLRFKPKAPPLSDLLEAIELTGRGVIIDTLRVAEVNGDVTVTRFTAVDVPHRFTTEEARRLFSIDAR